jgi:hypothetical protein
VIAMVELPPGPSATEGEIAVMREPQRMGTLHARRAPPLAGLERFAEADVVYRQAFMRGLGLLSARHAVGRVPARIAPHSGVDAH